MPDPVTTPVNVSSSANSRTEITPESMKKSFVTYEKSLIMIPQFSLEPLLGIAGIITGVRHKHNLGKIEGKMELAPWNPFRYSDNNIKIEYRELETFLGNNVVPFDPTSDFYQSVLGSMQVQEGLENTSITQAVWTVLFGSLGEGLFDSAFTAKRNDDGEKTSELYNGWKTIVDAEIEAGNISAAKGNFFEFNEFTTSNAVDNVEAIYDALDPKLKMMKTTMLMSPNNRMKYLRDYRATFGSLPYNTQFEKTYVEGSENLCEIKALQNVPDDFIQVTVKGNPVIGLATSGKDVTFECKEAKISHFLLDFVASMFFGVQYRTIQKEFFLAAKMTTT